MKSNLLLAMVAVVLVVAIMQSFQIKGLQDRGMTGNVISSAGQAGETYEEMMARMHPEQAQAAPQAARGPSMVGGC